MKRLKCILVLLLSIPFSCIDDTSKFGSTEIDEIKIEGVEGRRVIEIGSKLEVTPVVTTKFGENSELSYVWYKYNLAQKIADTLSFEKNLSVVIGDVLPGVETTLAFKVIDDRTGVFVLRTLTFVTTGKYSGGTLMLCKTGGEIELNMLKQDGSTFYDGIYSLANDGEKLGVKSKKIILTDGDVRQPLGYKSVIVTCDDETGGVYLDPTILTRKDYMKDKFLFSEDMSGDLIITGYTNDQGTDYLIVNGKVHSRENGSTSEKVDWNPEAVFLAKPLEHSIAAYTIHPDGYPLYGVPLFYDNINGRFVFNKDGGYYSFIAGASHIFSKFDPSAIGKGVELVVSGNMNSTPNQVWALMWDSNKDEYFMLTYQFVFDSDNWTYYFESLSKSMLSSSTYPDLYNASIFIPGTKPKVDTYQPWEVYAKGISDMFFFVSNNKVFAFNVQTLSGGVVIDGMVEGYTITGIDCTEIPEPTLEDPKASFVQLTLAVKDNALTSKVGGVALYRLSSIGGISVRKMYAKTGFCDEVIASVEKLN